MDHHEGREGCTSCRSAEARPSCLDGQDVEGGPGGQVAYPFLRMMSVGGDSDGRDGQEVSQQSLSYVARVKIAFPSRYEDDTSQLQSNRATV